VLPTLTTINQVGTVTIDAARSAEERLINDLEFAGYIFREVQRQMSSIGVDIALANSELARAEGRLITTDGSGFGDLHD
jgi:hypothetical protein